MRVATKWGIAVLAIAVLALSGCSFGDDNAGAQEVGPTVSASDNAIASPTGGSAAEPTTVTSTTMLSSTVPSTVVAWKRGDERAAWEKFLESFEVLDSSEFSRGPCGVFAMMLTEGSVTFYWWNGREWVDRSSLLVGGQGDKPAKVYTRDFTLDGVLDFFVQYEPSRDYRGQSYGAYFAYPWPEEQKCQWTWIDVDDGRDLTKRVISPDVDQRNSKVFGDGFVKGRWGSYGSYEYLGSSSSFVFHQTLRASGKDN